MIQEVDAHFNLRKKTGPTHHHGQQFIAGRTCRDIYSQMHKLGDETEVTLFFFSTIINSQEPGQH